MRTIGKTSALILLLFIALSSITALSVKPANAQTIPPPSVPQFTVQFVNASYGVTTTNPYTGQNQTQQVSNCSIQVTIKNQPLNNYALFDHAGSYQLYYGIRIKPHFGNLTEDSSSYESGWLGYKASNDSSNGYALFMSGFPAQSNNNYTVITYAVMPTTALNSSGYDIQLTPEGESGTGCLPAIPYGGQLDFQVEALVGHNSSYWFTNADLPPPQIQYVSAIAYDSNSSWSGTQTITLVDTSTSNVSSPTFIPVLPTFVWFAIIAVLGSALILVVVVKSRRFNH